MVSIFKETLTADAIKGKARALGADLVGIADGAALEANPPPDNPQRPSDITDHDGARVIVLAKRLSRGVARIAAWNDRHKYYNDELALTRLEEASLELVYWLEDNGYPAIIVPPTHSDPWTFQDGKPKKHLSTLLSLPHAAVEAGLGTLGLNLQLLALPESVPGRRGRSLEPRLGGVRSASLAARLCAALRPRHPHHRGADARGAEGAGALGGLVQSLAKHPARRRRHHRLPQMRRR